jgi:hypothetical protein
MPCKSHCFYKEEKISGSGGCFLSLPGPMQTCEAYKPPATINPAPLDPEAKAAFEKVDR